MTRLTAVLAALVTLAATSSSAGQGQVRPDPEQIVTLMIDNTGSPGPCDGITRLPVNAEIDPADGSTSPFVIPADSAFVLTGGTWSKGPGLAPGSANILKIFLTTATTDRAIVLGPAVPASVSGWAAAAFVLQPGIVVRPGATLCAGLRTDNTQLTFLTLRLSGFIVRDR